MSPNRPFVGRLPDRLVPVALTVRRRLPDEVDDETASIPFARIARYACYALVVFAVGLVCAGVVYGVFDLFTGVFYAVDLYRPWLDLLGLIRDTIEAFALLIALGVFLTQFE